MLVLVLSGLAAARRVAQTRQTRLCKAAPPLADRRRARAHSLRHRLVAQPLGNGQDHFRPKRAAPSQPLKVARCSSVNITSAALITAGYHLRQFTQLVDVSEITDLWRPAALSIL